MSEASDGATDWSRELTVEAARLWRTGASAGTIAQRVGVSRGAVIDKLRRIGVKREPQPPSVTVRPPPARAKPNPRRVPAPACEARWTSFADLPRGGCR